MIGVVGEYGRGCLRLTRRGRAPTIKATVRRYTWFRGVTPLITDAAMAHIATWANHSGARVNDARPLITITRWVALVVGGACLDTIATKTLVAHRTFNSIALWIGVMSTTTGITDFISAAGCIGRTRRETRSRETQFGGSAFDALAWVARILAVVDGVVVAFLTRTAGGRGQT